MAAWVRPKTFPLRTDAARAQIGSARLRILAQVLRETPEWRAAVGGLVRDVLAEASGFELFCETGMPARLGLFAEASDRIVRRLLPAPPDPRDLGHLLLRMLPKEDDATWLEGLPSERIVELLELLAGDDPSAGDPFAGVKDSMADAASVVAVRIASLGTLDVIRTSARLREVRDSPFLALPRLLEALLRAEGPEAAVASAGELTAGLGQCRRTVSQAFQHLEESGVSLSMVYHLELLTRQMDRLQALARLLAPAPGVSGARTALDLTAELIRERIEHTSLGGLLNSSSRLLARKVAERAGHSGEHYITSSGAEYREMWRSAAGGGALTAVTAAIKYAVASKDWPLFFQMAFHSTNYSLSFLLMQALGFTLATKQPSMTAAALAGSLKQASAEQDPSECVDLVARITRSQLAAALGNIGLAIPSAALVELLSRAFLGHSVMATETAEHMIASLHPFGGPTIPFAILTGFFLWLASVVAGGLENWAVYRRLPEAIGAHRGLVALVGAERAAALGRAFENNVSGIGGNVALGVLLGSTPSIGRFFGVALDARHVTLSTAALVLSVCALGAHQLVSSSFVWAALGVGIIGCLNFGVSFALALAVAMQAREVRNEVGLLRAILARFRRAPREFFLPPKDDAASLAA
jgi:site-specific recombinase